MNRCGEARERNAHGKTLQTAQSMKVSSDLALPLCAARCKSTVDAGYSDYHNIKKLLCNKVVHSSGHAKG
tara:strand:+ start:228 stop:437 length:210 start_codon:yes stop_codon:yes gene_type:complete